MDNAQTPPTVISSFAYDINGNQIRCNTERHYEWDYADRMRAFYNKATSTSEPTVYSLYLYDGEGKRIKKLVRKPSGWESVTYVDEVFKYHKKGSEEKNYIQLGGGIEIRIGGYSDDISDKVVYQLKDHLGSVGIRMNQSGGTIDREEYYSFGDSSLRTFTKKRYRYCGKEKDEESGLYYYGARYYIAWVGRFVSVDPLAGSYAQLSPYNYASNSPIGQIDVDGMQNPEQPKSEGGGGGKEGGTILITGVELNSVTIHEIYTGDSSPGFKSYINSIGVDGLEDFKRELYRKKLTPYQVNRGLNALAYPSGNVPYDISKRLWMEADGEALPMLKELWTQQQSGVDPVSLNFMFNPLARAKYYNAKAQTVSGTGEGFGLLKEVGIDVASQWIGGRFTLSKRSPLTLPQLKVAPQKALPILSEGENIALGVREYLDEFAESVNGNTWKTWGASDFETGFLKAINDPSSKIHFNLTGIDNPWSSISQGAKGYKVGGYTNWELYKIYSTPGALERTIFYRNGGIVPNPFK